MSSRRGAKENGSAQKAPNCDLTGTIGRASVALTYVDLTRMYRKYAHMYARAHLHTGSTN